MTRRILAFAGAAALLLATARCQAEPATAGNKPVITAVLHSIDELYNDLKLVFDLAGDQKGYKTLKETIEVFLEGVETDKPAGIRVYLTADGLRPAASLPVGNDADLKKFLLNLFDLDVKTAPPPTPALLPQVPPKVRAQIKTLGLHADERIIFGLYDAFLKYSEQHVHLGELLGDVRLPKGGVPADIVQGLDLAILIDGSDQKPADRVNAFANAKKEILAALEKGEDEHEDDFALRKSLTEHQVAEIERFYADSSKIRIGWETSAAKKHARLETELVAVADTPLAKSIQMIDQAADDFSAVSNEGAALSIRINFPVDPMRQQSLQTIAKQARASLKRKVDEDKTRSEEQKAVDKDLTDLVFDVVDDIGGMGLFNGFLRTWPNADGTLTTVGATKVPQGAKFVALLNKFASRGGTNGVEKVGIEGDVEIHKLTVADLQKDYPEVFTADGTLYVGIADKAVWYAFGDKSLEKLKQAIGQVKAGEAKPGPVVEVAAKLLPLVEVFNKVHSRKKASAPAKGDPKAKKAAKADRGSMLADLDLPAIAIEAFKEGQDTFSLSLVRKPQQDAVEAAMQLDEGILRFVGKALSKFVKDNLGDE